MSIGTIHNESLLLQQVKEGSEPAFTAIYLHYSPQIYQKVVRILKDTDLTEELVQELFTRIWQKREKIDTASNFSGYLAVIATHLVHDAFREFKKDRAIRERIHRAYEQQVMNGAETLDYRESKAHLEKALSTLSPQQYKVYQMCKVEGYTYREVAEKLGIAPSTVKDYLAHASNTIRRYMSSHLDTALIVIIMYWLKDRG